jgi:cytochrome d ubiquinol oxidase subunit I
VLGVVTGIPMEFQFGTNWSEFARRTGGVIGQPLAMEGVFSFFLESTFLGLFLFGRKSFRAGRTGAPPSWSLSARGSPASSSSSPTHGCSIPSPIASAAQRLLRAHQLLGPADEPLGLATVCAQHVRRSRHRCFVMSAVGAFYLLQTPQAEFGEIFLRVGVIAGILSCIAQIFPTGDLQGRYMAKNQPIAIAGHGGPLPFGKGAPIVLMGQPDFEQQTHRQPHRGQRGPELPHLRHTAAEVKGLDTFPGTSGPPRCRCSITATTSWPASAPTSSLLMAVAAFLLWRGKLYACALGAVAHSAELSAALHREYRRLDDR